MTTSGNIPARITRKFCDEYFEVDPTSDSGLRFKKQLETKFRIYKVGCQAGMLNKKGYWVFGQIGVHRIVFMMHNDEPRLRGKSCHIDHINRVKWDNRPENLRACTPGQNCLNTKKKKNRLTGLIGVKRRKTKSGKFRYSAMSQIGNGGRKRSLGTFDTREEAAKVYDDNVLESHGEFAVTNKALGYIDY